MFDRDIDEYLINILLMSNFVPLIDWQVQVIIAALRHLVFDDAFPHATVLPVND